MIELAIEAKSVCSKVNENPVYCVDRWQYWGVNTGVSGMYSTWVENMELLFEVRKCILIKRESAFVLLRSMQLGLVS